MHISRDIILKLAQDNTNIGKVADFIISRRQNLQVKIKIDQFSNYYDLNILVHRDFIERRILFKS